MKIPGVIFHSGWKSKAPPVSVFHLEITTFIYHGNCDVQTCDRICGKKSISV